jgi:hypothetical protein
MLEIDFGGVLAFLACLAAAVLIWRGTSKRKSIARAAQADDLARLLSHLYEFTDSRRGVDATAAYVASEIDLYRERKKL